MSDQEKFEAQGRAYAALKEARSNVATLAVALGTHAQTLAQLSHDIQRLVADPARDQLGSETLQRQLREMSNERAILQIGEIFAEAQKAQRLHEQINQF
jgi:transposase-like protein